MGLSEAEELELLELENENALAMNVGASESVSKPKTLAGKVASFLPEISPFPTSRKELEAPIFSGQQQDQVTMPLRPVMALEKYGSQVKDSALAPVERLMDSAAYAPMKFGFPKTAAVATGINQLIAKPALRMATPFTPSEFGSLGAMAMIPTGPKKAISPNLGKSYMEHPIPSTAEEIRHSQRYSTKDAADFVVDRPKLGNSRGEILENSKKGISAIEKEIQKRLDETVKKGKISEPVIPNDRFSEMQTKLQEPTILPSSGRIQKFTEPESGTSLSFAPENLNLQTKGKKFSKGESKGIFNPESPEVEAKQIKYLKEQRAGDVLEARKAFKERMSDPEYGYRIRKEFAIGRDDISRALDKVAGDFNKTGMEKSSVEALKEIKIDFTNAHPEWADAQYWNDIKRSIHKIVGDKGYIKQNPSYKVQALKAVANSIRKQIEKVVPGIKDLNAEQGALLDIRDSIIQSSPREVRDISLFGPFKERGAIMGGRFLSKKRQFPNAGGMVTMPMIGGRIIDESE